jgi:hypothetical protein
MFKSLINKLSGTSHATSAGSRSLSQYASDRRVAYLAHELEVPLAHAATIVDCMVEKMVRHRRGIPPQHIGGDLAVFLVVAYCDAVYGNGFEEGTLADPSRFADEVWHYFVGHYASEAEFRHYFGDELKGYILLPADFGGCFVFMKMLDDE